MIGIDGGTRNIIETVSMPFLYQQLENGINLNLEEDLWSRGWAEILSGQHGRETGAFYYKPKLDGTHDITSHFGTENYHAEGIKPLWQKLTAKGYKVGFMNVPTTMPAPKVDGFFISGAGAGFNPVDGLPKSACHPSYTYDFLKNNGYPWQVRFMASGIKDIDEFVDAITVAIEKRATAFINFCQKYYPDFAFLVQSENTPIQNIAMVEIEELVNNDGNPQTYFQNRILEFYSALDANIEHIVETIQPDHLIIVSDHGASPRKTSLNINSFLQNTGYQSPLPKDMVFLQKNLKRKLAKVLPKVFKKKVRQLMPNIADDLAQPDIDWQHTVAFGGRYIPGIYINDLDRFGGPVVDAKQKELITIELIDLFNKSREAKEIGLHAGLYRNQFQISRYNNLLPEIWINSPDTVFFEGAGPFIEHNKDYNRIEYLTHVTRDLFTGFKGRWPLACIDKKLISYIEPSDNDDLTQIHQIIERFFNL